MGVFEAGRGRLVEQGDHLEAGLCEGVQRQEALRAGRVGRHTDRGFDTLTRRQVGVRTSLHVALELGKKAHEQVGQRIAAPSQLHRRSRPAVAEQAFEGPQHRPARVAADGGGVQPKAKVAASLAAMIDGHVSIPSNDTTG